MPKGYKHTSETRAKMSAAHRGRPLSPETRAKLSAVKRGRPKSPEHRAKLLAVLNSSETKAKIVAANRSPERRAQGAAYRHTVEARAKMSASRMGNQNAKGHRHSAETRARISAAGMGHQRNKGRLATAETRAKMSATRLGRKLSPEHRAKQFRHQVMADKLGPHWRTTTGKMGGAVAGSRPRTKAQLAHLAGLHKAKVLPRRSREFLHLMQRTSQLMELSRQDLLLVEDLADERDAKAWVRSRIECIHPPGCRCDECVAADPEKGQRKGTWRRSAWALGLKGHRITYTLDQARQAGYKAKLIAAECDVSERHGRDLLKLVNRADAARAGSTLIQRLSMAGL